MDIFPQLVINSILAGSIYALVALGFNLLFGTAKFFNFAHGAFATIGGYAVFFFSQSLGMDIYLSIILGIIIAGLIGWLSERTIFSYMRKKKSSSLVMLIASLGLAIMLQSIIAIIFTSQFQTLFKSANGVKIFEIGGGVITATQIIIVITSLVTAALLLLIIKRTKLGKAIQAISDDEEVAKVVGIKTEKVVSIVFFISAAIAGIAGIAVGFDTGIQPTMGMPLFLKGVIASIIGGIGNVYGSLLGAFLLGFVENFGIWKISGEWKDAIAFLLLVIFLIFRPEGILKKK